MSLGREQLTALAAQAAELLRPGSRAEVVGRDMGGQYWLVDIELAAGARYYVDSSSTPLAALESLIDAMANDCSEGDQTWGIAFPPCLDGHVHPSYVRSDERDVLLVCPATSAVVARVTPAVAA